MLVSRTARGRRPQITTRAFTFGAMARECPDLQSLARLIEDIRADGNAFIVRGELDELVMRL